MSDFRKSQRGEGKLGCIITFLLVVLGSAVLIKLGPVYYSNMELADRADAAASMASRAPAEQVEAIRDKRPCRLSAELGVHIVELIETLQYPDRFPRPCTLTTTFEPIAPLSWK